jgi:alpha-tubulin suppressor-like RCC1 family protein
MGTNFAALKSNGSAWCWGPNGGGQLGDNTLTDKSSPIQVIGNHSFIQIGVGNYIDNYGSYEGWTCALKADGSVWAWGYNGYGQLGDNTTTDKSSPIQVIGNHSFIKIAANIGFYAIGLKSNGSVWAWGYNQYGQLGDNTTTDKSSPIQVIGNHSFVQIVNALTSAALKADGSAWTWGYGLNGQLGNNSSLNNVSSPVAVVGNHSFVQICALSQAALCALKADGSAWTWGYGLNGQLGNNSSLNNVSSPVAIVGNHSFIKIADGFDHFMALKADGSVWAWGVNSYGQLGDNAIQNRSSPVLVVGNHRFIQISGGEYTSAALKSDGSVWMWGHNDSGQLGNNTTQDTSSPVLVVGNTFANLYGQMLTYYSGWRRQQKIIIDHTKVSADETNFPVLLVWTGSAATSNIDPDIVNSSNPLSANSDGSDIRASSDQFGYLPLPVDVVLITKNSSTASALLEVHVNVPYVSSTVNTTFYIWYGNSSATMPAVTDMYGRNAVWTGHTAVWHMTGSGDMTDVTGNGYTAVNTSTTSTTGLYNSASARAFVGSVPQFFTITGLMGSPAASTLLGVVNCTTLGTNGSAIVSIGNANNLQIMTATTQGAYYEGSVINAWIVSSQTPTLLNAGWAMASYSASPSTTSERAYVNGSGGTDSASAVAIGYTGASAGPNTKIGTSPLAGDLAWYYTGSMEEIRVLSVTKAASWHTTTYNNLLSAHTFLTSKVITTYDTVWILVGGQWRVVVDADKLISGVWQRAQTCQTTISQEWQ